MTKQCRWHISPYRACICSLQQMHHCWSQVFFIINSALCVSSCKKDITFFLFLCFQVGKVSLWNDGYSIMPCLNTSVSDPWQMSQRTFAGAHLGQLKFPKEYQKISVWEVQTKPKRCSSLHERNNTWSKNAQMEEPISGPMKHESDGVLFVFVFQIR